MPAPYLTLGTVARQLAARHPGCHLDVWQVRRVFDRGLLPPPARIGAFRVVPDTPDDLRRVEAALVRAGYLPAAREEVPA